jgi:hypothetical protein
MRQELTFLSHLTRLIGQEPEAGYARPGANPSTSAPSGGGTGSYRALDLQA